MSGKYDSLSEGLVHQLPARGVFLVVSGGPLGDGISYSRTNDFSAQEAEGVAMALEQIAAQLRRQAGIEAGRVDQ